MAYSNTNKDFFKINVTNSQNDHVAFDIKFAKSSTVGDLKEKLQLITGGNANTMKVELHKGDTCIAMLDDDSTTLGTLNITFGMHFHVKDPSIDTPENVEKFNISDQDYEQMDNTLRNFLRKNRLGKYKKDDNELMEQKQCENEALVMEKLETYKIGDRCQVSVKDKPIRRGTIMYVGPLEDKSGIFIGIKYDEPTGKNDGSINGKRYFTCRQNYGSFVPPSCVEVGDFPELPCELDDELLDERDDEI